VSGQWHVSVYSMQNTDWKSRQSDRWWRRRQTEWSTRWSLL